MHIIKEWDQIILNTLTLDKNGDIQHDVFDVTNTPVLDLIEKGNDKVRNF